jgi:predicted AlkP superfamily phosphohydrolase/phosphomutase
MGMDTQHPVYDAAKAGFYNELIHDMYRQMDAVVGRALEKADDNTILLVISDHGFGSFRRQVHVNRWLIENGFMYLRGSDNAEGQGLFENVDWARTRAYALGFASIYINLGGRERSGIVKPGEEYEQMCTQISASLENLADTDNGNQIVHAVYRRNRACGGVPSAGRGPDLLVGLRPGYRFSWQTALGAAPPDLIEDNTTQWCGDHIFDPSFVPGIVLSSERLSTDEPCGLDIAPTVLRCLGLTQPAFMIGKCLAEL